MLSIIVLFCEKDMWNVPLLVEHVKKTCKGDYEMVLVDNRKDKGTPPPDTGWPVYEAPGIGTFEGRRPLSEPGRTDGILPMTSSLWESSRMTSCRTISTQEVTWKFTAVFRIAQQEVTWICMPMELLLLHIEVLHIIQGLALSQVQIFLIFTLPATGQVLQVTRLREVMVPSPEENVLAQIL